MRATKGKTDALYSDSTIHRHINWLNNFIMSTDLGNIMSQELFDKYKATYDKYKTLESASLI